MAAPSHGRPGPRALALGTRRIGAPCSRINTQPADSIGIEVRYRYNFQTPFLSLTGISSLVWYDTTVMALNPTGN